MLTHLSCLFPTKWRTLKLWHAAQTCAAFELLVSGNTLTQSTMERYYYLLNVISYEPNSHVDVILSTLAVAPKQHITLPRSLICSLITLNSWLSSGLPEHTEELMTTSLIRSSINFAHQSPVINLHTFYKQEELVEHGDQPTDRPRKGPFKRP